jgi:hypothetical protein
MLHPERPPASSAVAPVSDHANAKFVAVTVDGVDATTQYVEFAPRTSGVVGR